MFRCRCRRLPPPAATFARRFSRVTPPADTVAQPIIRVSNNLARLGSPKEPKPRQLLFLPPFPPDNVDPLPGRKRSPENVLHGSFFRRRVTAITWVKHYFDEVASDVIQRHFREGLVQLEVSGLDEPSMEMHHRLPTLKKIKHDHVMKVGQKIYVPVSVVESRILKRYDTIPTATLHPNADEIEYLRRLVMYKDSAIIILNKPPRVPAKGHLPVHNSMDVLAAAALSYGNEEGPKLVHRLDKESSGLLLLGRKKESLAMLHWLFTDVNHAKTSSQVWNYACERTMQRYWALVIGSPQEKQGVISRPLTKVLLNDGKTERVMLAHPSGLDAFQEAITEYRMLGPTINGCSWLELRPLTGRKHQLRVHCAEALGTPIVGDYNYGWFVHKRWKQMPRADYEPSTGAPYKLRRPEGLAVQKGSVLSKVPLLHLHCRELVIPNIAKFLGNSNEWFDEGNPWSSNKPDVLRFVAPMPSHMKISWNCMSSFLV
ncbi:RNA pseudouridine synthase 3, mitochondrial isoform X2 [Phalaenopsis equestris]|uniref:RNA pseudouridine synthase 3, mitochondrial isoform X2 n=1 Tax=Phalaenopsis equestris TaxID=78828 RepID=UPI0009E63BB0|nr:RNA pseudouridine synthase 3, mitochondrial isoform X2 [Phalaenopsis equestris]